MSSLAHHGVKGQKWGVRRYQNPDGTRTALGKKHYSVEAADIESTRKDIKNLVKKFSKKDKKMFFDRNFWDESYDKTEAQVAKRFVIKEGRDIVAFIDAQTSRYDSDLNMVIGTAQCARGKGYASILSKKMVDWYESEGYKDYGQLEWNAYNENVGSRKAAEKAGFKQVSGDYEESNYLYDKKAKKELNKLSSAFNKKKAVESEVEERINSDFEKTLMGKFSPITRFHAYGRTYWDIDNPHYNSQGRTKANLIDSHAERWAKKKHGQDIKEYTEISNDFTRAYAEYNKKRNKVKHSSIGGNMNYIYGNTLVLGDSSYLEHHGIKNQKWGVRRFQNPDGSLTAAGRIRYGVTGAAKAAFKVGKKLGAATASAARAGVNKAKDNAYEKKKEKAAQTREGVLKNKKMFTNEELERLEKRFKIEDDMRNADLRHGQEIAKTISAYSDAAVKTMNVLQTGGKAVKAISDGLSALKDYKEKNNIKHSDMDELAHFGVKGMKWGKHLMAGKGSSTDISSGGGGGSPEEEDDETIADILGIDVDAYRQKINEGPFGYGQYADQLGEKAEKLHAQAEANRKMADQVGLTGNKKKAAEFRKKSEQLKKDAVKAEKLQTYMNRRANGESALGITADTVNTTIVKPITSLAKDIGRRVSASNPMNSDLVRKLRRVKHGSMGSFMIENGILRYGFDESDYLEHHGIKGQRWGVRRFQNADGSLTDKGRKHYQKKLALEERKLTAANAARGQYERVRTPMSVGMGILGAVAGAMVGVPAGPAGIAAGAAVVSSIAASSNYAAYTVAGIVAGQGAKRNMKKIAKYKEALAQDAFEIQNGVLIYGSGQSEELKHFGLKGMKWGVRRFQNKGGSLTDAGKKRYSNTGELDGGGGGGGSDEEDEETKKKIEEAAKKAGMTVDEYRKKFADKIAAMKKKDRSWKYDSSISTKDMRRMAKDSAESTERLSKKAHEAAMPQNSALRAGNKKRASTHGWAATQYNTLAKNEQTGGRYSAKNVKRNYDSTLEGKATKLRYATQRAKQRVYNAAGGKYKEEANTASVYREREKAKENRAIKAGNQYDAEAARSWQGLYSQSEKAMNSAYRKSIAGRYDTLKAKRKKKSAKHSAFVKDGTLCLEYHGINFPKR